MFDKVLVLYEGRQIYFGPAQEAKSYFDQLGFQCPESQTTADFLTSMCTPVERIVRPGFENLAPRTPEEFAQRWKDSPQRQSLLHEIEKFSTEHPLDGPDLHQFAISRRAEKSPHQREKSPYTLSYWGQVKLCLWREWQSLRNDPSVTLAMLIMNFLEALIIASIFYNLAGDTSSFFYRGALLFMMVVLNAFGSVLEILTLCEKRTIVEKQSRYAYYHPSAEAISSFIMSIPYKFVNSFLVNLTLYFMSNLRRQPGPFFFFLLISMSMMLAMSMFFRWFASLTKTIDQALAPSSINPAGPCSVYRLRHSRSVHARLGLMDPLAQPRGIWLRSRDGQRVPRTRVPVFILCTIRTRLRGCTRHATGVLNCRIGSRLRYRFRRRVRPLLVRLRQ